MLQEYPFLSIDHPSLPARPPLQRFALRLGAADPNHVIRDEMMSILRAHDAAPLYKYLCAQLDWPLDNALLSTMTAANVTKLASFPTLLADAEENHGDVEIRQVLYYKATYLAYIGDKDAALVALDECEKKTVALGQKLDLVFHALRLGMLYEDWHLVKERLAKAAKAFGDGADWERKNRLKVYEAVFCMATRNLTEASKLFLGAVATFTTSELMSYEDCIAYSVLMALVTLDRPTLRTSVLDSPEVRSVMPKIPHVRDCLEAMYGCKYADFFQALVPVAELIHADPYLRPHTEHYLREIRLAAYKQFLAPFKTARVAAMAAAFGVSEAFLDQQLADFIVAGRLGCKIDRVEGVIVTNQLDQKNTEYHAMVKAGDGLLNRIQKLSRVVDIE